MSLFKTICLFFLVFTAAHAQIQQYYSADSIMITAQRFPASLADVSRSVAVLDSLDLAATPVGSFQDMLDEAAGLDLQRRGPFGVQADVSIRGASIEGTKILIDGLNLNDSQTAHHNLNIPIARADIERVEILRGGGSSLFGANAVGGVINIITKSSGQFLDVDLSGGQYGFYDANARIANSGKRGRQSISFSNRRSSGYMPNTAFDMLNVFYKAGLNFNHSSAQFIAGLNDKQFEAGSFYSPLFPNEWEHTKTALLSAVWKISQRHWAFNPSAVYRRHFDDFVLDSTRPDWYRNKHTTHSLSIDLPVQRQTKIGRLAAAVQLKQDWLISSNLGEHQRQYLGFSWVFQKVFWSRFDASLFAFSHYYSEWGWHSWPGLDVGYRIGRLKLFASSQSAFRIPSFTELYYQSPGNIGNPDLHFEKTRTDEFGLRLNGASVVASAGVFRRHSRDVIDWIRSDRDEPWHVRNIGNVRAVGYETQLRFRPSQSMGIKVWMNYSYIAMNKNSDQFQSKYALRYLKHSLLVGFDHHLPAGFSMRWLLRVKQRVNESRYTLLDCSIRKAVHQWQFYLKATNMLDTAYYDFVDVPMPGRWIVAGLKRSWH